MQGRRLKRALKKSWNTLGLKKSARGAKKKAVEEARPQSLCSLKNPWGEGTLRNLGGRPHKKRLLCFFFLHFVNTGDHFETVSSQAGKPTTPRPFAYSWQLKGGSEPAIFDQKVAQQGPVGWEKQISQAKATVPLFPRSPLLNNYRFQKKWNMQKHAETCIKMQKHVPEG